MQTPRSRGDSCPRALDAIIQAVQAKIDALRAPLTIRQWQFKIGAAAAARQPQIRRQPVADHLADAHMAAGLDGAARFGRARPAGTRWRGIPLADSRLELDLFLRSTAGVYVSGKAKATRAIRAERARCRLLLEESLDPGTPLAPLVVPLQCGRRLRPLHVANLRASAIERVVFALDIVRGRIDEFTRFLAEKAGKLPVAEQAAAALNLDALAETTGMPGRPGRCGRGRCSRGSPRKPSATPGPPGRGSHIDMNWLWPMAETVDAASATLRRWMA